MTPVPKPTGFLSQVPTTAEQQELIATVTDYLRNKGVSLDQLIANGGYPALDSDPRAQTIATVRQHTKKRSANGDAEPLPGILFNHGEDYFSFRYLCDPTDYPTDVNTQRSIKLATPSGRATRPFKPRCINWEVVPDNSKLRVAESALKAIALAVAGIPAIGLNGVYTWSKNRTLHPTLVLLFRSGKYVPVICFDANAHPGPKFNHEVAKAKASFARALYQEADVPLVLDEAVPYYRGQDQGIDDYLGRGLSHSELRQTELDYDGTPKAHSMSIVDDVTAITEVRRPLIQGLMDHGDATLFTGIAKKGKTKSVITMAVELAAGVEFLFGNPDLPIPAPVRVLLVLLEDRAGSYKERITATAASLGVALPSINANLRRLVLNKEDYPGGVDVLEKIKLELKVHPSDLVILDNYTVAEVWSGRLEPLGMSLVNKEYKKMERYTTLTRDFSTSLLLVAHSKKGAGKITEVADKGNSTATAVAAVDNIVAFDVFTSQMLPNADYLREISTALRNYPSTRFLVNIGGEGAVRFHGRPEDYNLTAIQAEYVQAVYKLAAERGDLRTYISAKLITIEVGGKKSDQTVRNALRSVIKKGWLLSREGRPGVDGSGYCLTERAITTLTESPVPTELKPKYAP